jgi:hypothetical protein
MLVTPGGMARMMLDTDSAVVLSAKPGEKADALTEPIREGRRVP